MQALSTRGCSAGLKVGVMALGFKVWVCGQIYGLMFIARNTYIGVLVASFALKNLGKHVRT